ncbi:MAG: IPT/TIG domain-containing protein [Thermoleophilaceae bacterium]
MRSRTLIICFALLAAALTAMPASAGAAGKKAKASTPKITRVTPMRLEVGQKLTIRGLNFKAKVRANTVILRNNAGRTAFVKPRRASRRKLVIVLPESVARLLTVKASRQRPTRLKLRVLAGRFSKYTPRRLSPVVLGTSADGGGGAAGGGGGGQTVCNDDDDHDNDLLTNALEAQIKTDPCLADTDGDEMTDGWEYYSARDLNVKAVPYPGKRPYTNALDPSDGAARGENGRPLGMSGIDFDGDGLTSYEEYRAWRHTGSSVDLSQGGGIDLDSPLGYSDGTKTSRPGETPAVPAWRRQSYDPGLVNPGQPFPATFNLWGDGIFPGSANDVWRDDERDADGDGLSNWLESARGPSKNAWWQAVLSDKGVQPWPDLTCAQEFGYFEERPFAELDLADPDVDGDTVLDGEDDQDHDDYDNITELYEAHYDLDGDGGFVCGTEPFWSIDRDPTAGVDPWVTNPFNPCAPNPNSRTCHDYKRIG